MVRRSIHQSSKTSSFVFASFSVMQFSSIHYFDLLKALSDSIFDGLLALKPIPLRIFCVKLDIETNLLKKLSIKNKQNKSQDWGQTGPLGTPNKSSSPDDILNLVSNLLHKVNPVFSCSCTSAVPVPLIPYPSKSFGARIVWRYFTGKSANN